MTTLEQLVAARKLIAKPENWCQGTYRIGDRYCMDGALIYSCQTSCADESCSTSRDVLEKIVSESFHDGITSFNDTHTHPEVLAVYDKAIELKQMRMDAENAG